MSVIIQFKKFQFILFRLVLKSKGDEVNIQSFDGAFGDNRVSLKSRDSYMISLVKKTFGKETHSLYINGMSIFPVKMKTS